MHTKIIKTLEDIIYNWYEKETLHSLLKNPSHGLCSTLNPTNNYTIRKLIQLCIKDYNIKYNGTSIGFNFYSPVEGNFSNYIKDSFYNRLYYNPKRLHLAVFMLAWFRHNSGTKV